MKNLNFPQKIIHLKINLKKKMATENLKIPTEKVSYEKMFFKIKYVIINTTGSTKITLLFSKNPLLLGRSKKNGGKFKKLQMDESGFHTRWIRGGVSGAIHLAEIRSDWLGTVMLAVNGHSFRAITLHTGRL